MKKLLLLLGFLASGAHAQDEYYSLSSVMTNVTFDPTGSTITPTGPVTVSGWIETSGFGKACNTVLDGPGPCLPVVNGHPTNNPLIINYEISLTYNGVTETAVGPPQGGDFGYIGIVATSKGLFCNLCGAWNEDFPYFTFGAGRQTAKSPVVGGAGYEWDTPFGAPLPDGLMNFYTAALKNNFRIGNAPTTTMPVTKGCVNVGTCILSDAMVPASKVAAPELELSKGAGALMLLAGVALVLQGRHRG